MNGETIRELVRAGITVRVTGGELDRFFAAIAGREFPAVIVADVGQYWRVELATADVNESPKFGAK